MKFLFLPIFSFLLSGFAPPASGQVIDASSCDSTNRFPITHFTSFLGTTSPITLDSVLKSDANFVKASNEPVLVFNYDPYYYWFRIIVTNPRPSPKELMLLMAPVGMYDGRLFQNKEGRWQQVAQTGLRYKFSERSYQFTHHVFPFVLEERATDTLYVSVDASDVYKSFGFALIAPRGLKLFENKIYFVFGIIEGMLILFFVLNISLFFALKEKLHLWYALYIALLFLVVLKNDHLDQQFLGLDSERAFRLTPYMTIGALAIAVLMHVVQSFLKDTLRRNKALYLTSTILKVNVLCSAVVHFYVFMMVYDYRVQSAVFSWAKLSTLLGIINIIINCLYCVGKGFKAALFLFAGSFVFMIGSVQRLFFPSTLSFLFPPTTFHIGIIVETFVISLGLVYRYWSEKSLQRKKEHQIQLQTMHDISEEIHDNVGPTLTLAGLNLRMIKPDEVSSAQPRIEETKSLISKAITDLRDLSRALKNESAYGADLAVQIKNECMRIEKTGIFNIAFDVKGEAPDIESRKQAILLRIVKEVLQNAIKHARATEVKVIVHFTPHLLSLAIEDNGIGFDLVAAGENSNGLENIKTRCMLLNATCDIQTSNGSGTRFLMQIPVEDQ